MDLVTRAGKRPTPEALRFAARMRADWDARARLNAPYFVDFGAWRTEEEILEAGLRDAAMLVRDLPLEKTAAYEILEIGCGIGRVLGPLADRVGEATGIDVSLEMLRIAAGRLQGRSRSPRNTLDADRQPVYS